jgi:hypothetical protein
MKVFISWSGQTSHRVAVTLRDWLPSVIQSIQPYVSSEDIDKGARWSSDIAGELHASTYGLICLTKDNINAPWINFEAGALGKSIDKARVRETLENPGHLRDNGSVIASQDWGNGRQAAWLLGLRADDGEEADQTGEVSL